uniref:Uncharacterized protein n=1 Tax=Myoviridae sp. ct2Pw37 TaxID=2825021 RepID=A0A8S5PBG6_9CAUD|nr:MAG TPA: hypothetical protein [Myoviridae sp. ct2Pw37]
MRFLFYNLLTYYHFPFIIFAKRELHFPLCYGLLYYA